MIYLYVSLITIVVTAFIMWVFRGASGMAGGLIKAAVLMVSGIILVTCIAGALSTLVFGSPLVGATIFITLFAAGILWFLRR